MLTPVLTAALDLVPVRVTFNLVARGDVLVYLDGAGATGEAGDIDVWFPIVALTAAGYSGPLNPQSVDGTPHVRLRELAPLLEYQLDLRTLELSITTAPEVVPANIIDLGQRPAPALFSPPDVASAYLNYAVDVGFADLGFDRLTLPLEVALRMGPPLLFSSAQLTVTSNETHMARLLSNVTFDAPDVRTRLVAGDVAATAGALGSTVVVGGLGVFTDASLNPYFRTAPDIDVRGVATTPSSVVAMVDDLTVFEGTVPPGAFELRQLPYAIGAGATRLVIVDAYGRTTEVVAPYYNSSALLRQGVHEFGYYGGAVRYDVGTASDRYGALALFGHHRLGLTDRLSAALDAEALLASAGRGRIGAAVQLAPLRLGLIQLGSAASWQADPGEQSVLAGVAWTASYGYAGRLLSVNLGVRAASRHYATVAVPAADDKTRLLVHGGLGIVAESLGSLGLSALYEDRHLTDAKLTVDTTYAVNLSTEATLLARASWGQTLGAAAAPESAAVYDVSLTLLVRPDARPTQSLRYQAGEDAASTQLRIQQRGAAGGQPLSYDVALTHGQPAIPSAASPLGELAGSGTLRYSTRWADLAARYEYDAGLSTTTAFATGAIATVGGSVYLTPPIDDSFALVRTSGLPDIRVSSGSTIAGSTNGRGELLLPDLIAYSDNEIELDHADVPFEYEVDELVQHVAPRYRSGTILEFGMRRLQAFVGTIYRVDAGEREPIELVTMALASPEHTATVVIGRGGEFYVDNAPPGSYSISVDQGEASCAAQIELPESTELFVDVGEVLCEPS